MGACVKRQSRPWKLVVAYASLLAAGTFGLQWLDYLWIVRRQPVQVYVVLVAVAFLGLGIAVGFRIVRTGQEPHASGNPLAQRTLGISAREFAVLQQLATGKSNKEIARALGVSPNTIKSHVANVSGKLGVTRRTQAIARARELGILP